MAPWIFQMWFLYIWRIWEEILRHGVDNTCGGCLYYLNLSQIPALLEIDWLFKQTEAKRWREVAGKNTEMGAGV